MNEQPPQVPPEQPNETLHQQLKRLSQGTQIGDGFVKGSNLGPITVHSENTELELSKDQLKSLVLDFLDLLAKNPPPNPVSESEAVLPKEPPEE